MFFSDLFSLPQNALERNSESFLLFLFHGPEFGVVFSSAEGFGTEFREFSVPWNSRNSVGNNHLFRLFRLPRNYFLSEIPNPTLNAIIPELPLISGPNSRTVPVHLFFLLWLSIVSRPDILFAYPSTFWAEKLTFRPKGTFSTYTISLRIPVR